MRRLQDSDSDDESDKIRKKVKSNDEEENLQVKVEAENATNVKVEEQSDTQDTKTVDYAAYLLGLDEQEEQEEKVSFQRLKKVIAEKEGKLLSVVKQESFDQNNLISVQCNQGHIWDTSGKYVAREWWCPACDLDLAKIRKYAEGRNGKVLSNSIKIQLEMQCSRGHGFQVSLRNYYNEWCAKCPQAILEEQMEELGMEQALLNNELEYLQQKYLSDARKQALEYLQTHGLKYVDEKDLDFQRVLYIYYFLNLKDEFFINFLNDMTKEQFLKEKRLFYKMIHPDKNNHPKSIKAFQKLQRLLNMIDQERDIEGDKNLEEEQ